MTIRRIKHHPADRSTGSVSTDPLKHEKGSGRAGLAVVAVLLSGPIALITIPAFWLFGYTLLQSVLLTALVQLAIFLGSVDIHLEATMTAARCQLAA